MIPTKVEILKILLSDEPYLFISASNPLGEELVREYADRYANLKIAWFRWPDRFRERANKIYALANEMGIWKDNNQDKILDEKEF